jgi:hypothetical protein
MSYSQLLVLLTLVVVCIDGRNDDVFNYAMENKDDSGPDSDGVRSFGQPSWDEVECDDVDTCVSKDDVFCSCTVVQFNHEPLHLRSAYFTSNSLVGISLVTPKNIHLEKALRQKSTAIADGALRLVATIVANIGSLRST